MERGHGAGPKRTKRAISGLVTRDLARVHESGAAASQEALETELKLRLGWTDEQLRAEPIPAVERLRWRIEAELVWTEGAASYYNAPLPTGMKGKDRITFIRNRDTAGRIHSSLFPEDD